jgi:GTPase SAR1 family protein
VYDITDNSSFVKVKNWVKELRSQLGKSVTLAIIGNKVDLEKSRAVNKEEALRYAIVVIVFLIVFLFLGPFTHSPAPSQLRAERGGKALRHFCKA